MRARGIPNGSRTAEALRFIKSEVAQGRKFPRPKQISAHMGWKSETAAADTLLRLCEQGHVVTQEVPSRYRSRRKYEFKLT